MSDNEIIKNGKEYGLQYIPLPSMLYYIDADYFMCKLNNKKEQEKLLSYLEKMNVDFSNNSSIEKINNYPYKGIVSLESSINGWDLYDENCSFNTIYDEIENSLSVVRSFLN